MCCRLGHRCRILLFAVSLPWIMDLQYPYSVLYRVLCRTRVTDIRRLFLVKRPSAGGRRPASSLTTTVIPSCLREVCRRSPRSHPAEPEFVSSKPCTSGVPRPPPKQKPEATAFPTLCQDQWHATVDPSSMTMSDRSIKGPKGRLAECRSVPVSWSDPPGPWLGPTARLLWC